MAIDTAAKRRSVPGISFGPGITNPIPDGTIGDRDRQHTGYGYVGIVPASPIIASKVRSNITWLIPHRLLNIR